MSFDIKAVTGKPSDLKKKEFSISPYSPIFMGSGQNLIRGLDFVRKDGYTWQLDLNKLFQDRANDLSNLEKALRYANLAAYLEENRLSLDKYTKRAWPGDCKSGEIKEPIKDGFGHPMIPGSSLKGSIRTALFASLFDEQKLSNKKYKRLVTKRGGSARSNAWASQPLQNKLLSTYRRGKDGSAPNYDVGRALQVADVPFESENLEIFNVAILNETNRGYQWKQTGKGGGNTPHLSEATKIGVAGISYDLDLTSPQDLTITIDEGILEAIEWKKSITHTDIAKSCNKLSKKLLEMDLAYLDDAQHDLPDLSVVIDDLEAILDTVESCIKDNKSGKNLSWIQRAGWGSGWLTMTGAHMYSNRNKNGKDYIDIVKRVYNRMFKRTGGFVFPKTRNIALDRSEKPATTMGWLLVEQK